MKQETANIWQYKVGNNASCGNFDYLWKPWFVYQTIASKSAQTPRIHHQPDVINISRGRSPIMYPSVNHVIITGPWSVPGPGVVIWAVIPGVAIPGVIPWVIPGVVPGVVPSVIPGWFPVVVPLPSVSVVVSSFISFVDGVHSSVVPWFLLSFVRTVVV